MTEQERDKCPRCGNAHLLINACDGNGDYKMYTCQNCYHRFDPDEHTIKPIPRERWPHCPICGETMKPSCASAAYWFCYNCAQDIAPNAEQWFRERGIVAEW